MDNKALTSDDIDEKIRPKVYTQVYGNKPLIDGIQVVELNHVSGEEGGFTELMRLNDSGGLEKFPGFTVRQINRSTQYPGSIKAWHMHFGQDELWYVPEESHLVAGFWDVRKGSKTYDVKYRIVMGGSTQRLIFIPRGVAHGAVNFSKHVGVIIYFMNGHFDKVSPDEHRLPWDSAGADFWKPERD